MVLDHLDHESVPSQQARELTEHGRVGTGNLFAALAHFGIEIGVAGGGDQGCVVAVEQHQPSART